MLRKTLLLVLCCGLTAGVLGEATPASAASKKRKKKAQTEQTAAKPKPTEYEKLFKEKHDVADGMIRLHKVKGKLYFEFPLALLGRDMLLGSTVSEISDNGDAVIGSKPTEPLWVRFTKTGDKVQIRKMVRDNVTDTASPNIARSLEANGIGAILKSYDIAVWSPDSCAVVFNATDLFLSDNKALTPFDPYGENLRYGQVTRTSNYQSDRSFLGEIRAFADNIVVRSHLSYTYTLKAGSSVIASDVPFTAVMTRSLVLLPEEPYEPRFVDSRMSVFPTGKILFSEREQQARLLCYANRWRVEPSDVEAYRRGERVKPKKPIVFYIDPDFPESWRQPIFEAVRQWNEPFERIGFEGAVEAREYPKDDPEFDPDNIKYSCIRYAPIGISNAMGPSWVDPRSGEIVNASVYVFHDIVKLVNNWRFIQTAQADTTVRSVKLPKEVLDDALRYVVTHEVGHCLGFMHNMSASAVIPVDSLRSPTFTQQHGTTTSIMDYARFNYVAQPGDLERGVKMTPPRFGTYDYYAVKWLYTPVYDASSPEEVYKITSQWITDAAADPVLRYGKQQGAVLDPRSQSEDLGDDAVKASQYGIANLKYILAHLNEWVEGEDRDYSYRTDIYKGIISQYIRYIGHVFANVGGIYLNEKHVGDPVEAYRSVPKERQREALQFLLGQLDDLDWLDNEGLMQNIQLMGSPKTYMQVAIIRAVVMSAAKVENSAQLSDDPYSVEACMKDIYDYVWKPTLQGRDLTDEQMMIQREYLLTICKAAGLKYAGTGAVPAKSFAGEAGDEIGFDPYTIAVPACLREYHALSDNLCYGASCTAHRHAAADPGPVSGYNPPRILYVVKQSLEAENYANLLRVQRLLKSRVNRGSQQTRMHYALLLHNIEKTLK